MTDSSLRRVLLEFELALDRIAADEVREEDWGRAFLSPSLPLVWDASHVALETTGLGMPSVEVLADRVLGGAGFAHRTVVVVDEGEGRRLAEEAEAAAGWEAERVRYMVWRGDAGVRTKGPYPGQSANGPGGAAPEGRELPEEHKTPEVREATMAAVAPLRERIHAELMPEGEHDAVATAKQLIELDRRLGEAGGDRWFVAPVEGQGASACRLFRDGEGIGQVEDVGTLEADRGRGLATAVVSAALAASRAAGDTTTFLTADAADWPQFLYQKLGFAPVGDLHILRRRPGV